jgi:predicted RNA binding protein YcfA (HicA-like mRNA interferase family)
MAKLRVLSGREDCQILAQHGFAEVRHRGSHIVMQRRTAIGTVTVPVPDHYEIRLGTLQSTSSVKAVLHGANLNRRADIPNGEA